MTQSTNTRIGASIGKFLGNAAAHTINVSIVAVESTGRFGQDIVAGATEQYVVKSAELEARREQARAELLAERTTGVKLKAQPKLAKPGVAKRRVAA